MVSPINLFSLDLELKGETRMKQITAEWKKKEIGEENSFFSHKFNTWQKGKNAGSSEKHLKISDFTFEIKFTLFTTEREEEARRQVSEYNKLKGKMKIALKDLELRENQLLEQERKVMCGIVVLLFQRESLHTMLRIRKEFFKYCISVARN